MGASCSSAELVQNDMLNEFPTFKVAIVGDSHTGKTAICNRFVKNCFFKDSLPTKRVDIVNIVRRINLPDHVIVSLTLWDTPGKEDIDLTETYFNGLDAAVVVVDVSCDDSMDMAGYWKQQVINTLTKHTEMSTVDALRLPILLLGNKYDLIEKEKPESPTSKEIMKDRESGKPLDPFIEDDTEELKLDKEDKWYPPCVDKINQLTEQHKFLAGVMVSAKESDGSIDLAMQTLIRHLADKHLEALYGEEYRKKGKKKHRKPKPNKAGVDTSLKFTGVEEIDEYIRGCEIPVQRITELKSAYERSLDNLKMQCADAELIPAEHYAKATLEQCITALKLAIGDHLSIEKTEGGMVNLTIPIIKKEPRGEIAKTMDRFNKGLNFHNEYAVVCELVLTETDDLKSALTKFDKKILKSQSEAWERQRVSAEKKESEENQIDFKVVSNTIEENRVQIAESLLWIEELYKHSDRAREKVQTALLW